MITTVRCPSCSTDFHIDTAKVPDGGVYAQCSECPEIFPVEATDGLAGAASAGSGLGTESPAPPTPEASSAPAHPARESDEVLGLGSSDGDFVTSPYGDVSVEEPPEAMETETPHAPPVEESREEPEEEDRFGGMGETFGGPQESAPAVEEAPPEEPAAAAPAEEPAPDPSAPTSGLAYSPEVPEVEDADTPPADGSTTVQEPATRSGDGMPSAEAPAAEPEAGTEAKPATKPFNPFLQRDPGERAARLARVLVSDMITYNREKHARALANGTLEEDFEEEIKKSWEEYVERIGKEMAESNDYFSQALNELLARGQKIF